MDEPEATTAHPPGLTEAGIRRWLIAWLAQQSNMAERNIDPTAPFTSFGVDSLAATELLADLEVELEVELDPTIVFSCETVSELARFLATGATGINRGAANGRMGATNIGSNAVLARATTGERHEPIAVVGIGCRFPGAHGPAAYWNLLQNGVDAVGSVPEGRWEDRDLPDEVPPQVSLGGFVDEIDQFDPLFFGISQLEADRMDPQQRMLLEAAWEALEDADAKPSALRGSPTGVFLGISSPEYGRRQGAAPELIDVFFGTGNALSIAANRISYGFDLRGPSMALDTACSSSLVAIHLACAAIRRGECSAALAGGANAILTPLITLNFVGAGAIAPDGKCKAFDASADGIVRGEGAGLVLLKPLSAAVANGDRIYCVIEGSATNSDGRSNGLTAPNPDAQIEVFAAACDDADVDAHSIGYVEAHGTGTVLGDAMELRSLDEVYGSGRDGNDPLLVGSVKTNIGHLESAAGIAGVIKTALAIHHGSIPPTLHYNTPNPFLERTDALSVVTVPTPWPANGSSRAGVSGFGFGGTNAHIIVGPPPRAASVEETWATDNPKRVTAADNDPIILPMSGRSAGSLTAGVGRFSKLIDDDPTALRELAVAQALTRDEHPRRLAIVADDTEQAASALVAAVVGKAHRCAVGGDRRSGEPARVVFLFSGQGRAWWPFDADLLADPIIAAVLDRCDAEMRELADYSIMDVLRSGEPVVDHERAQPLLYSLQVALAARWRAFGVEPSLIVGQSIGEVAAAHTAGAIPLADGLEIVLHRGRFMEESNGTGHTAFVELPPDDVAGIIERLGADVTIAGVTAPDSCLVSGPKNDTVAVVSAAAERGVIAQVFTVGDIPGHGPLMTPYADKLAAAVDFLEPRATRVPMISAVTGGIVDGTDLDAGYWGRNLRQTVRFTDAMATAVDEGGELFIEIAAHPVVEVSARRCLEALAAAGTVQHTIKQGEPGPLALRRSLASAWVAGADVDWRAVTGRSTATVAAPGYAWDHRRCWFTPPQSALHTGRATPTERSPRWHPVLDERVELLDPAGTHTWSATIDAASLTSTGRPRSTRVLTPGLVLELAVAATRSDLGREGVVLRDVELAPSLPSAETGPLDLQLSTTAAPNGRDWWLSLRSDGRTHPVARGSADVLADTASAPIVPSARLALTGSRLDGTELIDRSVLRPKVADSLRCVTSAVTTEQAVVITLSSQRPNTEAPWTIDPALLDGALAAAVLLGGIEAKGTSPVTVDRLIVRRPLGAEARAVFDLGANSSATSDQPANDLMLVDEWGAAVVELCGIGLAAPADAADELPGSLLVERWAERGVSEPERNPPRRWFCVGDEGDELYSAVRGRLGADHLGLETWLEGLDGQGAAVVVFSSGQRPDGGVGATDPVSLPLIETIETIDRRTQPELCRPRVYLVTRNGRPSPNVDVDAAVLAGRLGTLISCHPELRPTSIDVAGGLAEVDGLVTELRLDAPDDAVMLRGGQRSVGQLAEVRVPPPARLRRSADGRAHRAVWGDAGTIDVAPFVVPTPGADQVLIKVSAALIGSTEAASALPGRPLGVAAVGRVVGTRPGNTTNGGGDSTRNVADRTWADVAWSDVDVAVVTHGAVATHLVADQSALWPLTASGCEPAQPDRLAALGALARLDALHDDLLGANHREPALLADTFARFVEVGDAAAGAGSRTAARGPRPLGELLGAAPSGTTQVKVGDAATPVSELVDVWAADPSSTYLVGADGADETSQAARRFAVGWLLDRGATRVISAHPPGNPIEQPNEPDGDEAATGNADDESPAVIPTAVDPSSPAAIAELVARAGTERAPLAGLIWVPQCERTADALDRATANLDLGLFVTIGSTTGLAGARPGGAGGDGPRRQTDHRAAAVARSRCAAGNHAAHLGIGPIDPSNEDGVDVRIAGRVLDRLLATGIPTADYDEHGWSGLVAELGEAAQRPWFAGLVPPVQQDPGEMVATAPAAVLASTPAAARREVVATIVAEHIAEILGIDPDELDVDASVDTYGVDSLVGMELRTRIEATFGYVVPLTELSRSMTTNALAGHLLDEAVPALLRHTTPPSPPDTPQPTRAVPVRVGTGPTTWWVPGMFGAPEAFTPLGTALGGSAANASAANGSAANDLDMWAFRTPGLDPADGKPIASVSRLAASNLAVLRQRQPSGPYRIGGYSFGALVAFEMAAQLEAAGEHVDHLWLLDPPPPVATPDQDRSSRVMGLLCDHLNELFFGPDAPGPPLEVSELPRPSTDAALGSVARRVRNHGATGLDDERLHDLLGRLWGLVVASIEAMETHRPSTVIDAPSTLVHATEGATFVVPGAASDTEWADHFEARPAMAAITTDHVGLLREPHAAGVAAVIVRSLNLGNEPNRPTRSPERTPMTATTPTDTTTVTPTMRRRAAAAIAARLTGSPRLRDAVGAAGNVYRQADFFLRALGGERRFRRLCTAGEALIVGDRGQIMNLSGDPSRVQLGHHCLIDGFLNVQDYAYLSIGSYCGIGVDARIDCAGYVEIGNGCTLAEGVYIIDGLHHPLLANQRIEHGIDLFQGSHVMDAYGPGTETSFVRIEDLVWIGLRAVVLSGVTIGRGSVIAAGAVVSQDVPPFSVVAGNPGRVIGQIPAEDFDIETHPTYRLHRGDEPLPDSRQDPRQVLDEIAQRVANRPG